MKKILVALLALLLMVFLVGCNDDTIDDNGNTDNSISDDWTDMEFIMGEEKYTYPYSFLAFEAKGWVLEGDSYTLEAGKGWFNLLINDNFYDEELKDYATVLVVFKNETDEVQNVLDCKIKSVSLYKFDFNNGYEIELAKGIKWGNTEEEIVAAYGTPDTKEVYEFDDGSGLKITTLRYVYETDNMTITMVLDIENERGFSKVEFWHETIE
ncbi:MAG: hypothetical protein ACOX1F_00015 [Erysipelotrichaceae bacterium]|jgi:hypothetical protein